MRYWWVNQNQSYEAERREGLLWAPLRSSSGSTQPHWETMTEVRPGDVIFHYAGQAVRAVSTVTAAAIASPRPSDLPPDLWGRDGRLVRVSYREASSPVSRHDIPEAWKESEPQNGPFRRDAVVKPTSAKGTPCRGRVERDEGPFSPSRRGRVCRTWFVADEDATNLEDC
jgi:hypothetical protein